MILSRGKLQLPIILAVSLASMSASSNKLSQAIKVDTATNNAAIQSQKKIDKLSDQTQKALAEYRFATRQTKTLKTYTSHLRELVKSQTEEKTSLQQQLEEIETTQQEIVPLILRMLNSLESFIQLDLPFLPSERQHRLSLLKDMVVRADVTNAEKFRRIMEAFQIENDYGKTIEAYRADLDLNGNTSSVDFLRMGRVALYYQRLDGSETGFWNRETKTWETLGSEYRNAIRKGLRIARKETAPDLIIIPVPAAESTK
jgi:septal ring factor EnvC (AmiA/AmiB activator)